MSQNESFWICSPWCWGSGYFHCAESTFLSKVVITWILSINCSFLLYLISNGQDPMPVCAGILLVSLPTTFLASLSPHPLPSLRVSFSLLDFLLLFSYMPGFDFHHGFLGHYDFSNFFFFSDEVHNTVQVGFRDCYVISQMLDYRCGHQA